MRHTPASARRVYSHAHHTHVYTQQLIASVGVGHLNPGDHRLFSAVDLSQAVSVRLNDSSTMKSCNNRNSNKQKPKRILDAIASSSSQDSSNQLSATDDKEVNQSSPRQLENSNSSYRGNHAANGQDSSNDESDGEDCLRKSVLPVAKFDSYDENVPPKSGEEYLRRVQ